MVRYLRVLLVLVLLVQPVIAVANEQQETRGRLKKIQLRIMRASKSLEFQKKQEISLLRDLVSLKTSLQEIKKRTRRLQSAQKIAAHEMSDLRRDVQVGEQEKRLQLQQLRKRLVALYKEGDSGILRVLFSAESPMELAEQYRYLSRIMENDQQLLATFRSVLQKQNNRLKKLEKLKSEQQGRLVEIAREREDATSARRLQAQLLTKVRSDKESIKHEISILNEKAQRLETLIETLKQHPTASGTKKGLAQAQGELPWPVQGGLLVAFGTQRDPEFGTLYESHGIEIAAQKGTQVRAVADGKVVFADWFKGYGNLIIVSHPKGYHTLYAQAASLNKKIGDVVRSGETLATAGLAGERGIYFELRHNGAPIDPLRWLKSK